MPFSQAQFFEVFRHYNEAVWPMQWLLNLLAIVAIVLAVRGQSARLVSVILGGFWIWMGIAYHWIFFARINRVAIAFGALFVIQGLLLLWMGVARSRIHFRVRTDLSGALGLTLITYALLLYPALGYLIGRRYPEIPTFGLPCPTTIFTFGLLLWTDSSVPLRLVVIPSAWSLLGFSAARSLSMNEDYGLLIAGILATAQLVLRARQLPTDPLNMRFRRMP
jgi:hypothetical protein